MRVRSETKSELSEYQTWLDSSIQQTVPGSNPKAKDESKRLYSWWEVHRVVSSSRTVNTTVRGA